MFKHHIQNVSWVGLFIILFTSGCAWHKIPDTPIYNISDSLPLNVGIELADQYQTQIYGPSVIKKLRSMGVFKTIIYPYRDGDAVDGIVQIAIAGGWRPENPLFSFSKGFIIGASLFTLSPIIGANVYGTLDAKVSLQKNNVEILKYIVRAESKISFGILANASDYGNQADDLQTSKLAAEIAKNIESNKSLIIKEFVK